MTILRKEMVDEGAGTEMRSWEKRGRKQYTLWESSKETCHRVYQNRIVYWKRGEIWKGYKVIEWTKSRLNSRRLSQSAQGRRINGGVRKLGK